MSTSATETRLSISTTSDAIALRRRPFKSPGLPSPKSPRLSPSDGCSPRPRLKRSSSCPSQASPRCEGAHDFRIRWLDEELVQAGVVCPVAVRLLAVTRQGHEQRVLEPRDLAELPGGLVAVHARHGDIEKDDLWLKGFRDV